MKFCFVLLLVMTGFLCPAISQNSARIIHLKTLPAKGVLLDKGWYYAKGDNPLFAQTGYDDTHWQQFNPNQDIHKLPFLEEGVGWFRLHLVIDSSLLGQQLGMS